MSYKKRPKNKQELDPKSGKKKRTIIPEAELKLKIDFQFTTPDGRCYCPPDARIKINADGGVGFLIRTETGWKPVKAKLDYLKLKYERKLLDTRKRVPRKSS
jgi:hypothetical protein